MDKMIIQGGKKSLLTYLREVFEARFLIYSLAARDLRVQYAQTILGILWAALQPLSGLLIFTLFFDLLIDVDTGDIPYPLFAFTGMMSWYLFSSLLREAGTSLADSYVLIKNLAFPRLALPLAKAAKGLVEFSISLVILLVMMMIMGFFPGWQIVFLPFVMVLNIIAGLTLGIWLAAMTIRYRDFIHIIPYLTNFGIWLTPVFYPSTLIPEKYSFLLYLNPLAGIVEAYRWTLLDGPMPSPWYGVSFGCMLLALWGGLQFFRRVEKFIADYI